MNKKTAKILDKKLGCVTSKCDRVGGGSLDKRVATEVLKVLKVKYQKENE